MPKETSSIDSSRAGRKRLEAVVGPDLARFLVAALSGDGQGRRGSSSP